VAVAVPRDEHAREPFDEEEQAPRRDPARRLCERRDEPGQRACARRRERRGRDEEPRAEGELLAAEEEGEVEGHAAEGGFGEAEHDPQQEERSVARRRRLERGDDAPGEHHDGEVDVRRDQAEAADRQLESGIIDSLQKRHPLECDVCDVEAGQQPLVHVVVHPQVFHEARDPRVADVYQRQRRSSTSRRLT
jgi:hypothetical protein